MWRENLFSEIHQKFFGRTEIFRTDDGRMHGNFSNGRTKIFHPSGWAEIFRTAGRPGLRPAGRPNGRTDEKKKNEKFEVCLKR